MSNLIEALKKCLPYMQGLESDNIHDPSVGLYKDWELQEAYEAAKIAVENEEGTYTPTKLEYFTAAALTGIMSNQELLKNIEFANGGAGSWAVHVAKQAIGELAKAELKKNSPLK